MSEQTGNIYQKLAKVRKQVEVIRKNKSGYGYKYVTEDEILAKISVFMDKYHLSLVPSIQSGTTRVEPYTYKKTKTTGKGEFYEENSNEILVSADTFIEEPFLEKNYEGAKQWLAEMISEIRQESDFKPSCEFFKCTHLCEMQDECEYYQLMKKR